MDIALATRGMDNESNKIIHILENIQNMIKPIGEAMGVKYKKNQEQGTTGSNDNIPTLDELFKIHGGAGVVLKKE